MQKNKLGIWNMNFESHGNGEKNRKIKNEKIIINNLFF